MRSIFNLTGLPTLITASSRDLQRRSELGKHSTHVSFLSIVPGYTHKASYLSQKQKLKINKAEHIANISAIFASNAAFSAEWWFYCISYSTGAPQTSALKSGRIVTSCRLCCRWTPSTCTGNPPGLRPRWPLHLATHQGVVNKHSPDMLLNSKYWTDRALHDHKNPPTYTCSQHTYPRVQTEARAHVTHSIAELRCRQGKLPSSATLMASLKLLQWLRVSMEASSSLKGCTCPCCPPGGKTKGVRHQRKKYFSPIRSNALIEYALCKLGSKQVLQPILQLSHLTERPASLSSHV